MSESNYIHCKKSNILYDLYSHSKESFFTKYLLHKFRESDPVFLTDYDNETNEFTNVFMSKCYTLSCLIEKDCSSVYSQEDIEYAWKWLDNFNGKYVDLSDGNNSKGRIITKEVELKETEYALLYLNEIIKNSNKTAISRGNKVSDDC